jgi:hypothetical protein
MCDECIQSLHHVVADEPWSDEAVLDRCLNSGIPVMLRHDPWWLSNAQGSSGTVCRWAKKEHAKGELAHIDCPETMHPELQRRF